MIQAVVRWSSRARLYAAISLPPLAALTVWSYAEQGIDFAALMGGFLLLIATATNLHFWCFRIETNPDGIEIRNLLGKKRIPWSDIKNVELIAQWSSDEGIVRQSTDNPSEAYHIILVLRDKRINLNRHMDGIDDLIEAQQRQGTLVLNNEIMQAAAARAETPVMRGLKAAGKGANFAEVAFGAGFATFIVSLITAASSSFAITGSFFVDMGIVAVALLGLFAGVVQLAKAIRKRNFAEVEKEPLPSTKDLLMTYCAALLGPLMIAGFLPRMMNADGKDRYVDVILFIVGVWFSVIPLKEFYDYSFRR